MGFVAFASDGSFLALGSTFDDDAAGFLGAAFFTVFTGAALLVEELSSEESTIKERLATGFFANAGFFLGGASSSSSSSSEEVSSALLLRLRVASCLSLDGLVLALPGGFLTRGSLLTELVQL